MRMQHHVIDSLAGAPWALLRAPARRRLYYLVQSRQFEVGLMLVIVANSALMATTFYGEPAGMRAAVEGLNYGFTAAYAIEAALKVRRRRRR